MTGPAVEGSPTVFVNGRPAVRKDDHGVHAACCGPNTWSALNGSSTVFINGRPAHRLGDMDRHCGGIGRMIEGSPNVFVGGPPTPSAVPAPHSPPSGLLDQLSELAKEIYHRIFGEKYSDGITITGPKDYRDKVRANLDQLKQTPSGREVLDKLDAQGRDGKGVTIKPPVNPPDDNGTTRNDPASDALPKSAHLDPTTGRIVVDEPGKGTSSTVEFDPDYEPKNLDGTIKRPASIGLGHELIHATHNGSGTNLRDFQDPTDPGGTSNHEEAQTIGRGAYSADHPTDNTLRDEMGFPRRTSHSSL